VDSQGSPARVGRDGTLSLRFERRGPATVLAGCRFTLPLQVLAPLALDGPALVVSMLNPTGSVLGGDHLRIEACAGPGAHAVLTTPSATRVHRTDGPVAEQEVELAVAAGAVLEWVPDHTIPHAGAGYRQRLRAHVADDATLVVVDAFATGRVARGEQLCFRTLESTLSVTDDKGWLLHDRFVLTGDPAWAGLGFCEGAPYIATVAVVTPAPVAAVARAATDALAAVAGARGGVGMLRRRGLVVRCLADRAPALGDAVRAIWSAIRATALGVPALDLRKY
jgi:urease accessory protein